MAKKIITISREFGSGGRYIAKKLSDKLGIEYYDKDIIGEVASRTAYPQSFIEKYGEYSDKSSKSSLKNMFSPLFSDGSSVEDYLLEAQQQVVLDLASKGPCIIVGRSADYILSDRDDVLNVFIRGNIKEKIDRICRVYDKNEKDAEKMIRDMDKRRSINYNYWTDQTWGASENYDIMLNSSTIGYDKCIEIISSLVEI